MANIIRFLLKFDNKKALQVHKLLKHRAIDEKKSMNKLIIEYIDFGLKNKHETTNVQKSD